MNATKSNVSMARDLLTEEEKVLFRQAMKMLDREAVPIKSDDLPPCKSHPSRGKANDECSEELITKLHLAEKTLALSDFLREEVAADAFLSYGDEHFLRKQSARLQIGRARWQAKIDLHGWKIDLAKTHLIHFILQQYEQGCRCLLVIHGKGGQGGKKPILKNLVNRWLPQFPQVMAFQTAVPRDGGSGALYVWLKK